MKAIDIAHQLILEAQSFNTYGSANLEGMAYQDRLLAKFQTWKKNPDLFFDATELSTLKAIIAGDLIKDESLDLIAYPAGSDVDFEVAERIKKRTIHALRIAKCGTLKGAFNCEIATLVLCLALVRRIELPVELLNFSGVRDDGVDTAH